MAKGGGKRRTYTRDASGRFASSPGGGVGKASTSRSPRRAARRPQVTGGTLAAGRALLESAGAKLIGAAVLVELLALKGRRRWRDDLPLRATVGY